MAAALTVMSAASVFSFADGGDFALKSSTPTDGYEKVQSANVMVKLFFTEEVSGETTADMFTFEDEEGNKVPFKLVPDPSDKTNLNLLCENDLTDDVSYKVTVSKDLESADGDTLGKDATVEFSTKSSNMGLGYMLLMVIMIAVMSFTTIRDKKKKEEAKEAFGSRGGMEGKVETNPYKLAKERNISVQEASRIIAEEKEKARKKQEKMESKYGKEVTASKNREQAPKKAAKPEKKIHKVKTRRIVKR